MDELDNLRQLFLEEASELLEGTERSFLALESDPNDPSTIDQIFRLAHSLKGSAKAVGHTDLAAFTHALESLLVKVKKQEIKVNPFIIDLLLRCNDHIKQWVDALRGSSSAVLPYQHLNRELEQASSGTMPAAPSLQVPSQHHEYFVDDSTPTAPPANLVAISDKVKAERPVKGEVPVEDTIRVKLNKVDDLVNEVGELVILQTVLKQQKTQIQSSLILKTIDQLSKITRRIQDNSLRLRMIPLKGMFQKMQRVARDTSKALSKDVNVILVGEDIELDKTLVDKLSDPLVHLVRNAIDHGIEDGGKRAEAGKATQSTVRLSAMHQGGRLMLEVKDDGKGIDPAVIRKKAIEKGLLKADAEVSDEAVVHFIFEPGFSTKAETTEFSGRGVGLDVVKTNISEMKGELQIDSTPGVGTTFRIYLPLTLAIIEGIVIRLNETEKYVIPMFQVKEIVELTTEQVFPMGQKSSVFELHGKTVPIHNLGKILRRPQRSNLKRTVAIVVELGQKQHAFLVEQVINQQQVVIKKLGPDISKIPGISGSAILGDGRAAPILDLDEIIVRSTA